MSDILYTNLLDCPAMDTRIRDRILAAARTRLQTLEWAALSVDPVAAAVALNLSSDLRNMVGSVRCAPFDLAIRDAIMRCQSIAASVETSRVRDAIAASCDGGF